MLEDRASHTPFPPRHEDVLGALAAADVLVYAAVGGHTRRSTTPG